MNTTAMKAAMPTMLTTNVRVASSSGSYALPKGRLLSSSG
jgi:hypothetical protein